MNFDKRAVYIIGAIVGFILLMVFVFAGLLPGKNPPPPAQGSLSVWGVAEPLREMDALLRDYQSMYGTGITYQQFSEDEYERKVLDALAGGRGPDIFAIRNTWLHRYADKITPVPVTLYSLRDLQAQLVDVVSRDVVLSDAIYGLPFSVDTLALIYNRDIFNSEGVALPPATWDEFALLSQRLTKKEGVLGALTRSGAAMGRADNIDHFKDIVSLLLMQAGEQMTDVTGKEALFNRAGGVAAVDFYTSFAKLGNKNQSWDVGFPSSREAFAQGRVAMMLGYADDIAFIQSKSPQIRFGVAPAPQPSQATSKINHASYWVFVVSRQSENAESAWRFLVTMQSNIERLLQYFIATNKAPAQRALIPRFQTSPILGVYADQNLSAKTWTQKDDAGVRRVFANMINSILNGTLDSQRAVSQAMIEVSAILRNN